MNTIKSDWIIVGAGICGLTLAKELAEAGKRVTLVEGRDRPGGRIHTLQQHFSQPVDVGAEFIHGDLPFTKQLAKKAGVKLRIKKGKIYKHQHGATTEIKEMINDYEKVIARLKSLQHDMPLSQFLNTALQQPGDEAARQSVQRMAEGFDVANVNKISAFAVRDEWKEENISDPYVLKNGYGPVIALLYQDCLAAGCHVFLSSPVTDLAWKKDTVQVSCGTPLQLEAQKIIVTVPLGILTSSEHEAHHIRFVPDIQPQVEAARKIGYGSVVKVVIEFKTKFWDHRQTASRIKQLPKLGFLVTDSEIPTWWTHDFDKAIITGWAGGPAADRLRLKSDVEIFETAIAILADIFSTTTDTLLDLIISHVVVNWSNDPFSKGAYSYDTPESEEARKLLLQPLEDTLFFCGEALDENGLAGTVEAAISSAKHLLKKLL